MREQGPVAPCGICGKAAPRRYPGHPGYVDGSAFDIYHCDDCGTAFALPFVDTTSLYAMIYENASHTPGYYRYYQYAECVRHSRSPLGFLEEAEDIYWGAIHALRQRQSRGLKCLRALDIGSGLGYLTYALNQEGINTTGCDLSAAAVNDARKRFGDLFRLVPSPTPADWPLQGPYDIIFALEVIEHAPNPREFLQGLRPLLAQQGWIVLTTPNRGVFPAWTLWETDLPPVHYWWFTEKAVQHLAADTGWETRLVDYSAYHNRHPGTFRTRGAHYRPTRSPLFSKDGQLRLSPPPARPPPLRPLRTTARTLGLLPILQSAKDRILGRRRCGKQGLTLCAILERSQ